MFSSLFQKKYKNGNFEDIQLAIKHTDKFLLINTLSISEQDCLIKSTLQYDLEEKTMNEFINNYDFNSKKIIIYGKNTDDENCDKKYTQITGLGFSEVYIYRGGLFEWLLLQDIYGFDEFPTTRKVLDILKYKPNKSIKI
jgi:hypothetical protein